MDFELTDLGQEQAGLTGKALQEEAFDFACGSDLKRAFNTMEIIVAKNKIFNGPLNSSKLLREVDYGKFQGWSFKAIEEYREKPGNDVHAHGYETIDQVQARVDTFMRDLLKNAVENGLRNILVVTHSGTIRSIVTWLYNSYPIDQLTKEMVATPKGRIPNTAISKFSLNVEIGNKCITSGHCQQLYDNSHITS